PSVATAAGGRRSRTSSLHGAARRGVDPSSCPLLRSPQTGDDRRIEDVRLSDRPGGACLATGPTPLLLSTVARRNPCPPSGGSWSCAFGALHDPWEEGFTPWQPPPPPAPRASAGRTPAWTA